MRSLQFGQMVLSMARSPFLTYIRYSQDVYRAGAKCQEGGSSRVPRSSGVAEGATCPDRSSLAVSTYVMVMPDPRSVVVRMVVELCSEAAGSSQCPLQRRIVGAKHLSSHFL